MSLNPAEAAAKVVVNDDHKGGAYSHDQTNSERLEVVFNQVLHLQPQEATKTDWGYMACTNVFVMVHVLNVWTRMVQLAL